MKNIESKTSPFGWDYSPNEGGTSLKSIGYLVSWLGPVLESDMPFQDNENKTYLSAIEIDPALKVNDYVSFSSVYKYYDYFGNVIYTDGVDTTYTRQQVLQVRNEIKNHIKN